MADLATFLERVPEAYVTTDPDELTGRVFARDGGEDATPDPTACARVLLAEAPELDLLTPVVSDAYVDAIQQAVGDGTPIRVVATGEARQALLSGPLAAVQPVLATKPHVELFVHDGEVPFAVLVRPERVAFAITDETDEIDLLYVSDGATARGWARDVFDVYRAEADPLQ